MMAWGFPLFTGPLFATIQLAASNFFSFMKTKKAYSGSSFLGSSVLYEEAAHQSTQDRYNRKGKRRSSS